MRHRPWNGSVPTRRATATTTWILTAILLAPAAGATPAPAPSPVAPAPVPPPREDLSGAATSLQPLALPDHLDGELLVDLSLGGETLTLRLRPHDPRTDDFRMFVVDAAGT